MTRTAQIARDAFLTDVLKRATFDIKLSPARPLSKNDRAILASHLADHPNSFFYTKIPTDNTKTVQTLETLGFYSVDVNMMFEWVAPSMAPGGERAIIVRDARAADRARVRSIAASVFHYSRFHLDPQFSRVAADNVKRAWADNFFTGRRAQRMLVASSGNTVSGFLTELYSTDGKTPVRTIDLIAVDKKKQGRGVGEQLVRRFVADGLKHKCHLRVGTQAANIGSIRLYEKCGFRLVDSKYILHAHTRSQRTPA